MKRTRKSRDDPIVQDRTRIGNPSKRSGASAPDLSRVGLRPDPESWSLDELLTLPEAALLHWPHGPLTVTSLRTAVREGQLAVAVIAGKHFTTRRQLGTMTTCKPLENIGPEPAPEPQAEMTLTSEKARQLLDSELSSLRYPRISRKS